MNRKEEIVFFMHIHNSCTRNGDHPTPLIKTGNAHKNGMLSQTIIHTFRSFEGGRREVGGTEKLSRIMAAVSCRSFFAITEVSYLPYFTICCGPFRTAAMLSPKSFTIFQ